MPTVLVAGATGFVGSNLTRALGKAGVDVRCGSRDADRARRTRPDLKWVHLDVNDPANVAAALAGCSSAVYLVHGMAQGAGYEEREHAAASAFAEGAAAAGLERIVYLGGVAPPDHPSRHLRSRLATGELLRAGKVPVFELRAAMIIGQSSISWQIVRDLAHRLPVMILPRWLSHRSRPIGIDDVVFAIAAALEMPVEEAGVYDLPGPEVLSGTDILLRIARLHGTRPVMVPVPVLTPRLSSYWLKLVTGADFEVARELVEGLSADLLPAGRSFWDLVPDHRLLSFDAAARLALEQQGQTRLPAELVERAVARVSRAAR